MKKLITAAMALALFAGMASAQVNSDNIVGYQNVPLEVGLFTHVTPTFITVTNGVAQMTLDGLSGNFEEMDSLQFVDADFATANEYFYLLEGSISPAGSGWYGPNDFETAAGTTAIQSGISVLYSSQGTTNLVFAGEVNADDVVINSLVGGFTVIGNPFPVDTTLGDISFAGITEMSSVQFVDGNAATASEYFWLESGSISPGATGWYGPDDFETPADGTIVPAGKGFLFSEQGEGTVITFSSPLPL